MKGKLELTWVGKETRPKLEPRILLEDPEFSYHAHGRVSEDDIFDNRLIYGDNLLALKALEQDFAGKVKCIFIDPPYNLGKAFTHYDDNLEHSIWLGLLRDRIEILYRFLSEDGVLWATLDDTEAHYFKVMADEVFGRKNFLFTFIWRNVDSPNDNKVPVASNHNFVLAYAKNSKAVTLAQLGDDSILDAYPNISEDGRAYRDRLLKKNGKNSLRSDRPTMYFEVIAPDGSPVYPLHDDGREARWACSPKTVEKHRRAGTLVWKQREKEAGLTWVPYTREYAPTYPRKPYPTIWADLDTTRQTKSHLKALLNGVPEFDTPKPEDLVARTLDICTSKGDLVLDSFGGSGTTGAVAHKMGRRWIMVELGEHCHTHIVPRLRRVIDGKDQGGITKTVDWKGGGGYRYYRLAPSLIATDKYGNEIINPEFNREMLAEAVCKLEGFIYAPSKDLYWQHGRSADTDFIFVTTQTLTHEQLATISEEVGDERTLLVCCAAFRGNPDVFPNLTVKKIPKAVLHKCQWEWSEYEERVKKLGYTAENLGGLFTGTEEADVE